MAEEHPPGGEAEAAMEAAVEALAEHSAVLHTAHDVLQERLPSAGIEIDGIPPEGALAVPMASLVDACRVLKEESSLKFTMPLFCTVVDWLEREPRYDLVYQLRSLHLRSTIRLKVEVEDRLDGLPQVPTVSGVWVGMGCQEREAYDLFGIEFTGHPDMRRILMPDDWEGHPLRKDYISFGEPVKFSDRGSFPPESAVPEGSEQ